MRTFIGETRSYDGLRRREAVAGGVVMEDFEVDVCNVTNQEKKCTRLAKEIEYGVARPAAILQTA